MLYPLDIHFIFHILSKYNLH